MKKLVLLTLLPLSFCLVGFLGLSIANEVDSLYRLIKSRRSQNSLLSDSWPQLNAEEEYSPVYIRPQDGLMQANKIDRLPGQPDGIDFDQYSDYVTVDPPAGKTLFYYFVESSQNSSTNPLMLWLNGEADSRFLSNDAYTFLVNWLERFPQYKNRDFYIAGESYARHYVPQLAYTILLNNKNTTQTIINLKGIAIGNAWIDEDTNLKGAFDYYWTLALNSDETNKGINKFCDFFNDTDTSSECDSFQNKAFNERGVLDFFNIYAPLCKNPVLKNGSSGSVNIFDPCSDTYVKSYINMQEVQKALHAKPTVWSLCRFYNWTDRASSILPIIETLVANNISLWIYSGDLDARVPVTSSRYSINSLKLPIQTVWRPWYTRNEVGGSVEAYKGGLTFATVRGAGHLVPSNQPERALIMISAFLQGTLPPSK